MFETLLIAMTAFAVGFAAAWALAGKARVQLAETKARAETQERAAAEKLELASHAKTELSNVFKALSAEALNTNNHTFCGSHR